MSATSSTISEAHVAFLGHVREETVTEAVTYLNDLASDGIGRVALAMHTIGGELEAGMRLYESLRSMPFQVVTYAVGYVASIGIVIYLAGDERIAGPRCRFQMHRPTVKFSEEADLDIPSLQAQISGLEAHEARVRAVYEDRTHLDRTEIDNLRGSSANLGAGEAVSHGIAHAVSPYTVPSGHTLKEIGQIVIPAPA